VTPDTPAPRRPDRQAAAEQALRAAEQAAAGYGLSRPAVPNPNVAGDGEPDPHSVARAIVLRRLAVRAHSRAELATLLARKGCDAEVAARVLDRLVDVGLIDDESFAEQLVDSRQRIKGLSGAALRRELREKGIDDEIAAQAIGALDDESERARAEELVARRLRTMGGLAPEVQARRLAAMLGRKGYSAAVAYAVVRDAVNQAAEHARD